MRRLLCFLAVLSVLTPAPLSAQETPAAKSPQDLSLSVGQATFFKLTHSERTKPNFLDMALDAALQKFIASTIKKGYEISYQFLEVLPSEQSVVLSDVKYTRRKGSGVVEVSFGSLKVNWSDLMSSLQNKAVSFGKLTAANVKARAERAKDGKTDKISGSAKNIEMTSVFLGKCENMKRVREDVKADFAPAQNGGDGCIEAQEVFMTDGALTRSLTKEKYRVNEALLKMILIRPSDSQNPVEFSIGNVNGQTVRTAQELFKVIKQ